MSTRAIKKAGLSWRVVNSKADIQADEEELTIPFVYAADRFTPLMVRDAQSGAVRPMTQTEINALPAQKQAAKDAAAPDLAAIRDNATAAFQSNATFLAIATPTTAQVGAQVKTITQQMQQVIKALALLATKAL